MEEKDNIITAQEEEIADLKQRLQESEDRESELLKEICRLRIAIREMKSNI